MIKAVSFRLHACGCLRTVFPLAMEALPLLFLLVSTEMSQACAGAAKTTAHAKTTIAAVQAPSQSAVPKVAVGAIYVAGATAARASKLRAFRCCDTSGNQCAGHACANGCCAACAPAVLAPGYDLILIDTVCTQGDRQGPAVFCRVLSLAFRPPRTIA